MLDHREIPGWVIRWSLFFGGIALLWLGQETINDSIDGYNRAVDVWNWFINFWHGG